MRLLFASILAIGLFFGPMHSFAQSNSPRVTTSFDDDWRFFKGDPKAAKGEPKSPEAPAFSDTSWRPLSVPHDWSIEGPFSEKNVAGANGAFLPGGVGWYRKRFFLPEDYAQRRLFIEFDGIMAKSEVWINGVSLGKRPNGYVSFRYELTGKLNFGDGKTNVLAVKVDNARQPFSRYYTGSGIYRHVRLVATDPVHIAQWGTYITTPVVNSARAVVHLQTTVTNQSRFPREIMLRHNIFGPSGEIVQSAESKPVVVAPSRSVEVTQDVTILKPALWDIEKPNLYRLRTTLRSGAAAIDSDRTTFGIREAKFDPLTGFSLNGRSVKLKGVCLHQDGGAFGAAVPARIWEQRLEQLKSLGCNAIRTAHNPVSPEFLHVCDRLGFVVIDEMFDGWSVGKSYYDYHLFFKDWAKIDLAETLCRDRNHPSIILYSIGNEVRDTRDSSLAKKNLILLRDTCHQLDPTRPVTAALSRPDMSRDFKNGFADLLDVIGQNYRESDLVNSFNAKPTRKILHTESGPDRKAWLLVRDSPACAGQFLWTGVDYLGDARKWPWIGCGSGLLDRTGFPKPQAYERKALWSEVPMVRIARRPAGPPPPSKTNSVVRIDSARYDPLNQHQAVFPDWNPRNDRAHKEWVEVYGNCQEIELFLNGKSLGSKTRTDSDDPRIWQVSYEPGALRAIGKNDGMIVAAHELKTAGPGTALSLAVDQNPLPHDWDEVACVRVTVVDSSGVPVTDAGDLVKFKITGPGLIVAVDSAANWSHEPFQASERRACNAQCVAYIRATAATGQITVTASATGLTAGSVTIDVGNK